MAVFFLGLYTITSQHHSEQAYQAYISAPGYQADKQYCAYLNDHGMYHQFGELSENNFIVVTCILDHNFFVF